MKPVWKVLVVTLLLGGAAGAGAAWWISMQRPCLHEDDSYAQTLDRFGRRLHLTPEQRKAITGILEEKREKLKVLHDEMRPRYDEIRTTTRDEIRKQLTADQQREFDALQAEWESYRMPHRRP